jgi:predicted CXXCH cytochrome family protein
MKLIPQLIFTSVLLLCNGITYGQISPGELSKAHAFLEGVSNCTKCHDLGNKVTREKCLDCHKEINTLILSKKGFHASAEVSGKDCFICHNDHHGRNFQMLRFDKTNFDHAKTGFELKGAHASEACKACNCKSCHKPSFIKDSSLKNRTSTFYNVQKASVAHIPEELQFFTDGLKIGSIGIYNTVGIELNMY